MRANCCADKQIIVAEQPLESCETVGINNKQTSSLGYRIVNSCPSTERKKSLVKKCRGDLMATFEDMIWVTDKHTKLIYRNNHCAICHDVVDYIPWKVITDCMEVINGQDSPNEVINTIIDKCRLTLDPPDMMDHTDHLCLIPDITACNVTGQWKVYDPALETACKSFQQIYTAVSLFQTVIYRNIYCFLCNSQYPFVADVCPSEKDGRGKQTGFMGIFDFTGVTRQGEGAMDSGPVCEVDEVRDPFKVVR